MRIKLLASLVFCLMPLAAAAQTAPVKPGLWQMRWESDAMDKARMQEMEERIKNMPPEQRKQIEAIMKQSGMSLAGPGNVKLCMSKESLSRDAWKGEQRSGCKSDTAVNGNTWKFHQSCPAPDASETNGEAVFESAEHYTIRSITTISAEGGPKTRKMSGEAQWLGADCGDLKPITPSKK